MKKDINTKTTLNPLRARTMKCAWRKWGLGICQSEFEIQLSRNQNFSSAAGRFPSNSSEIR